MKYKAPFRVEFYDYEGFAIYDANDDYVPAETIVELLNSQQVPEEYMLKTIWQYSIISL